MTWYIAVSKAGRTMRAVGELTERGVLTVCPQEKFHHRIRGRRYTIEKPLLGRYLFVDADDDADLNHIQRTAEVDHILSSERGPLPVPGHFVDMLLEADAEGKFDRTARNHRVLEAKQRVRVSSGLFEGAIGELIKHRGHRRWEVLLSAVYGGGKGGAGKMIAGEDELEAVDGEKAA
jgi:transcription antitermination factor NusG